MRNTNTKQEDSTKSTMQREAEVKLVTPSHDGPPMTWHPVTGRKLPVPRFCMGRERGNQTGKPLLWLFSKAFGFSVLGSDGTQTDVNYWSLQKTQKNRLHAAVPEDTWHSRQDQCMLWPLTGEEKEKWNIPQPALWRVTHGIDLCPTFLLVKIKCNMFWVPTGWWKHRSEGGLLLWKTYFIQTDTKRSKV